MVVSTSKGPKGSGRDVLPWGIASSPRSCESFGLELGLGSAPSTSFGVKGTSSAYSIGLSSRSTELLLL